MKDKATFQNKVKVLNKLFDSGCDTEKKLQQLDMEAILKIPNITIPDMGVIMELQKNTKSGKLFPLSSKLKDNPVHVIVEPSEIRGYALSNRSDFMPEDIQTLNKGCVRFKSGYIPGESEIREAMDRAMIMQLNLLPVARKMVLEELEMKQNG